ncbi:hypothetical protein OSB04_009919 [Centaurea solstitialis]|uniref:Uncharacterized protein n=1 Tax=Centaurea solstitialis TaxID=347529 RepID=A0AA38WK51_9ASTR|nr:hypothetical protein OSB04_009919 [Centaurea solstitialis]
MSLLLESILMRTYIWKSSNEKHVNLRKREKELSHSSRSYDGRWGYNQIPRSMHTIDDKEIYGFYEEVYLRQRGKAQVYNLEPKWAFVNDQYLDWAFYGLVVLNGPKPKSMVFNVDLDKACDSVERTFMFNTLKAIGFGQRWCKWIRVCVESSSFSVLVNGSSIKESKMKKGFRQVTP